MSRIGFWINNARHIALPQSMLPGFLAVSMALSYDDFSWWLALLALCGVVCAHLGMNLLDDYYDYRMRSGEKRKMATSKGMRARMVKYPYLTSGEATVRGLLTAIAVFLAIAAVAGAVIIWFRGLVPLYIALAGAFLGNSYSGRPFRLGYKGYGELIIGLMFGPLLMAGVQYAACGVLDTRVALIGVAVGLLVTNIVYTHSVLDIEADAQMEKLTLAGLLKTPRACLAASAVFTFVPFLLVAGGVLFSLFSPAYLVVLALLPMAAFLWRSLWRFANGRDEELVLHRWFGSMGDFEAYRAAGMDWFMYRWLLSRNLISFFAFLLILVNVILKIVA